MLKMGKTTEIMDTLTELKTQKIPDNLTAKHLIILYNELHLNSDATALLEQVYYGNQSDEEMAEELFFSYVRENKLLKQQNHALSMYKSFNKDVYSQWAVESMYLIQTNMKFETRILDIAYLLLLKMMKEPDFKIDQPFALLFIKILKT